MAPTARAAPPGSTAIVPIMPMMSILGIPMRGAAYKMNVKMIDPISPARMAGPRTMDHLPPVDRCSDHSLLRLNNGGAKGGFR